MEAAAAIGAASRDSSVASHSTSASKARHPYLNAPPPDQHGRDRERPDRAARRCFDAEDRAAEAAGDVHERSPGDQHQPGQEDRTAGHRGKSISDDWGVLGCVRDGMGGGMPSFGDQKLAAAVAKPVQLSLPNDSLPTYPAIQGPGHIESGPALRAASALRRHVRIHSVTAPNDKLSYAAFALVTAVGIVGFVRRARAGTGWAVTLQPYDAIPFVLMLVWFYGVVLGFARHNQPGNIVRNFAGMTMYLVYYLLLANRIRPFDAVRCVLAAAAVNTIYMYGFFGWDKVFGPMLGRPDLFPLLRSPIRTTPKR